MLDDDNTVEKVRLRIRDAEGSDQSTSWDDTYSLIIREDGRDSVTRTYAKTESALEIGFEIEHISVDDIPQRVAEVMKKYISEPLINWPSSYSAGGSAKMEEVEITAKYNDDVYRFRLDGGKLGRVENNGKIIGESQVPHSVKSDTDPHIPDTVEFV